MPPHPLTNFETQNEPKFNKNSLDNFICECK